MIIDVLFGRNRTWFSLECLILLSQIPTVLEVRAAPEMLLVSVWGGLKQKRAAHVMRTPGNAGHVGALSCCGHSVSSEPELVTFPSSAAVSLLFLLEFFCAVTSEHLKYQ